MLHRITLQHRSRLLRINPPALLHCVGGFSFNHVFQIHNPPIGRNPPRHNSTGNVPFSGNPSNIDAGRYLLQPVSDYIPAFSFPSIGRRNSYNNNAPNPGANCGYRRCTLCRNYRISFLLLPFVVSVLIVVYQCLIVPY